MAAVAIERPRRSTDPKRMRPRSRRTRALGAAVDQAMRDIAVGAGRVQPVVPRA